jgi:hypothetical protein
MARKPQNNSLSARVSDEVYAQVSEYVEAAEIGIADLVREAVAEFIMKHPITKGK